MLKGPGGTPTVCVRPPVVTTVTALAPAAAKAESARPSPLKSATATARGPGRKVGGPNGVNVPEPLPSREEALLPPKSEATRSGRPSALRSPAARFRVPVPTLVIGEGVKDTAGRVRVSRASSRGRRRRFRG